MIKILLVGLAFAMPITSLADQEPSVHIKPPQLQGSRPVEKQTESSVIRNYLESWKTLQSALDSNKASLLDANFVGTARDKLADTIEEQSKLGIHTHYIAHSHDLQIVFYSPEGSSIELLDTVEYDEEVLNQDRVLTTKPIRERYLVVLTPSEVRWRVRILQADVQ